MINIVNKFVSDINFNTFNTRKMLVCLMGFRNYRNAMK